MRGRHSSFLGFVLTAVVAVPSAAFVMQRTVLDTAPKHEMALTSASGNVSIANSHEGQAILTAAPMVPGSQTTGTVEIENTGDSDERLVLDAGAPTDSPGPGGGKLSERLQLRVEDVTKAGPAELVYSGPLTGVSLEDLGRIAKDASRLFRFVVSFPDGGSNGADNAYMGSSATIGFDWSVTQAGPAVPEPDAPLPEQVAGDAPLAYWPMDGSTSEMDDAGGEYAGTWSNSVTAATGPAPGGGTAAWFDGAGGYGFVNGIAAPTQAYTLEAWVRPAARESRSGASAAAPSQVGDMIILEHGAGGTLAVRDGHFVFRHVGTAVSSSVTALAERWQHVVGVWDGSSDRMRLYVDGELVASADAAERPSGAATLYAGRGDWDGLPFFHGAMAQAAYYDAALAGDRIDAHWTSGKVNEATTPTTPSTPSTPSTPENPGSGSNANSGGGNSGGSSPQPGQMTVPDGTSTCPGSISAQGGASSLWATLKARSDAAAKAKRKQAKKAKNAKKKKSKRRSAARGKARAKAAKKTTTSKRATCRTTQRASGD